MELNLKQVLAIALGTLAIGFAVGGATKPDKIVTKIETQIVEKQVVKNQIVKSKDENRNKETIITETILPDGTKKIEKRIVDRSVIETDINKSSTSETSKESTSKSETVVTNSNQKWNVAFVAGMNSEDDLMKKQFGYGAVVQYRLIGPFSVGGTAVGLGSSSQFYGLTLGVGF